VLLGAGADINARDAYGNFPADLADDNEEVRDDLVFRELNEARKWGTLLRHFRGILLQQ